MRPSDTISIFIVLRYVTSAIAGFELGTLKR